MIVRLSTSGVAESPPEALRHAEGVAGAGLRQQHDELVAAEPSGDVGQPLVLPKALGDSLKDDVPELMAAAVVHRLQPVAVDHHHGELVAVPAAARELLAEAVFEPAPVQETRERVGDRGALLAAEGLTDVDQGRGVLGEQRRRLDLLVAELRGGGGPADHGADGASRHT